jgi:flagellar motility protein MotE (MotC chaperone)
MNLVRDLRLIPVVALAAAALFLLKVSAIVVEGGYTLAARHVALAQGLGEGAKSDAMPPPAPLEDTAPTSPADPRSWVRDIYGPPEYTGSVAAKAEPAPAHGAPAEKGAAPAPAGEKGTPEVSNTPPADVAKPSLTPGERAVLESLQQRRQELETRAREMDVRENLLKAAEKRIEQRVQELKETEARITGAATKKDEEEAAKFKSLVSMYENMKAKDAAKFFDRLNMRVLIEVANAMNPRRMSDVLGQMSPEVAERLTIEIANRSGVIDRAAGPAELPKIEGRPNKS